MCKLSFFMYKVIFIATFAGHGLNSVWLSNDFCWIKPPESSKDGIYFCLRNRMRTNYCLCKNYMFWTFQYFLRWLVTFQATNNMKYLVVSIWDPAHQWCITLYVAVFFRTTFSSFLTFTWLYISWGQEPIHWKLRPEGKITTKIICREMNTRLF